MKKIIIALLLISIILLVGCTDYKVKQGRIHVEKDDVSDPEDLQEIEENGEDKTSNTEYTES